MTGSVLVVGASGLVGAASVDAFLDAGWDVTAVSRRRPEVFSAEPFRHLALDLRDPAACRAAADELPGVTHVVYTALYEKPGLVAGWKERDQMEINLAMLRNLLEPLAGVAALQHVTLLQGTKAYGVHRHPIRIPARERHPRDDHPNFYCLQEDYLRATSAEWGFAWTILRPQLIVGPAYGVAMNLPPVIGAYAAICRKERRDFGFPGGIGYVTEAVDTRLVANAALWAATSRSAWGEHFNLTNGEVFEWRDLWPALADALGVEPGPDRPVRLGEFLPAKSELWDDVVRQHRLRPLSLPELLGESHHYADFCFAHGAKSIPPPAFISTVKIKQAGFCETWDTEESMRYWLQVLIDRRVLPSRS
ncbi:SDR family oxidoreductase [Pseudonocardia nigra]|uniref:SDR family oxidoreductase n=1 Tax=Pseudonocardia nigra TaxID=1921578 RepID=UPI001C5EF707|nr:SDR family oxidoreductase [Pseudonocardia nigra]